jgi:hypothetical protein
VLGLLLAAVAVAAGVWTLVARVQSLRADTQARDLLEELKKRLDRLLAGGADLDLRRVEHLLIDLRDGSRRLEDLLVGVREGRSVESDALVPAVAPGLGERVVNRLLALGYERIELVTGPPLEAEGQVLVEARREGVLHKGRVLVRAGRIEGVEIMPAYSIFP